MSKSLILTIYASNTIITLTKDNKTQEVTVSDKKYKLSIQDLSFNKKMYHPGELIVDLQLELIGSNDWVSAKKKDLESLLLNKEVTLQYGTYGKTLLETMMSFNNNKICDGYYVYEVNPRYLQKSMFVTLKIYSPDKVMTLEKGCQTWVAERLGADIIDDTNRVVKLPYDLSKKLAYSYTNMQVLKPGGKEEIFPYLVQYNESYYDFLARTCNRWGEFLYYEGSSLNIGYNSKQTVQDISQFDTITYLDLNKETMDARSLALNYADGTTHDEDILKNALVKGDYDKVKALIGCSIENGGDIWVSKIVGNLLSSGKNLYDFTVDTLVDEYLARQIAEQVSSDKNEKFDKDYFTTTSLSDKQKAQYNEGLDKYNQFSTIEPKITSSNYVSVLNKELHTAEGAICINFDTEYKHLPLGTIITINGDTDTEYIVVEAGTKTKENLTVKDGAVVMEKRTTYQVIATKKLDNMFYPTVLPTGHIRTSGAQIATVVEASLGDPTRQNRVRVQFPWQKDKEMTPWLEFARPGGNKNVGTYNRHYKGEKVVVAFANDNLERPYVLGAIATKDQTAPASTYTNDIVHVTPGGQAIKMNDGTGAGLTAMIAALSPSYKLIQGLYPGASVFNVTEERKQEAAANPEDESKQLSDFEKKEKNRSFEGSIELADKYGFYSIKGSTDGRNVTIKSPFGDVKLSAFTGITISAPNGDVKIAGKNVTIEAGNNLTLTSGKNIKDQFFDTNYDATWGTNWLLAATTAATKKIASMVGGFIDLSILRHTAEVFFRPIEGKLTVKSNRYLALEAGKGKTAYPVDAYEKGYNGKVSQLYKEAIKRGREEKICKAYEKIEKTFTTAHDIASLYTTTFVTYYQHGRAAVNDLEKTIISLTNYATNELPCRQLPDILTALWDNPDANLENTIGYKGVLTKAENDMTDGDISLLIPIYKSSRNARSRKKALSGARSRQETCKRMMNAKVAEIANCIKSLKNLKLSDYIDNCPDLDNDIKNAIRGTITPKDITVRNSGQFEMFITNYNEGRIQTGIKQLSRKMYIALVDAYKIPREEVGGVAGVGGAVPPEPDPYADNIEEAWNNYVDSIQQQFKPDKTAWADTVLASVVDPISSSITGLIDDAKDFFAFGSNKNGKILFSDGGATKILNKNMDKAGVREIDDPDVMASKSKASAERVRNIMKA